MMHLDFSFRKPDVWRGACHRWPAVCVAMFFVAFSPRLACSQVAEPVAEPIAEPVDRNVDPLMRVEIDWEIRIKNPNDLTSSPQISLIISAFPHLNSWHGELLVNSHRTAGETGMGGIGTQLWNGLTRSTSTHSRAGEVLAQTTETLKITQSFGMEGEVIWCRHVATESMTWGTVPGFGGGMSGSQLPHINDFDLQTTIDESGVTAGRNRVEYIRIKKVRFYYNSGLIHEESLSRDIFQGLTGDATSAIVVNADGSLNTVQPIDTKTYDAVDLGEGF